ncbi:MAG: CPBP family intramembrane metalloprotease [Deltaproteobacteria bacterium]|nr:CPBP family intramembrane metalloprotease [Deltaproteobacteria bacterium]
MFRALFTLVLGSLLVAALLTPAVASSIYFIWPEASWPFSRIYDRVAMVAVVVLLYILRGSFDLSVLRQYFARYRTSLKMERLFLGLLISSLSAALLLPLLVSSGRLVWSQESIGYFVQKAVKSILAGVFVSFLEESLFRGLIFSALKKRVSLIGAVLITSWLYAFVHFIAPVKTFAYTSFSASAGFYYTAKIFGRFLEGGLYPAMFGLFLVGLVLCYVMQHTGSLFLCIGLHSGWAAGLKVVKHVAVVSEKTVLVPGLGERYFLLAEPLAWLSIALVAGVMVLCIGVFKCFKEPEQKVEGVG